ncbi:MAG: dihydrolipoyl dehydrogenase [Candidatus Omnitrophica bacterium]|nr:dihydrolipoyl dehydrogenase [Candidatus Omnitrophota bacterium]
MENKYDYIVIGSGPAGHVSAIRAAQLGLKTAVIEKDPNMLGGVCLNEGCIPAKSLINSAKIYGIIKNGSGVLTSDLEHAGVSMKKIVEKSRQAADQLSKGLAFLFKKNGIDLIEGTAKFVDKNTLLVTAEGGEDLTVTADKILIATGSAARALRDMPFDGRHIISSSQAIRLDSVPEKILIVGGGAIGTEFASFFNMIGTDVTVVEIEDSLLPGGDKEVSRRLATLFKKKGINVWTSCRVKEASPSDGRVSAIIETREKEISKEYDFILVSIGRDPSTSGLALDSAGVETDENDFVKVNEKMQTTAENIYAAGDVLPTPLLAHMASAEGEVAAEAAAGHDPEPIDYSAVPNAVYTDIQVASVGLTEEEAKARGIEHAAGKQFFKSNGKAVVIDETDGFIKVIAEISTGKILGVHMIGHEATELIHEFVVAKKAGLTVRDIATAVHAHPTLSETAIDACRAVFDKPIHG